jgi:hypothetical protein
MLVLHRFCYAVPGGAPKASRTGKKNAADIYAVPAARKAMIHFPTLALPKSGRGSRQSSRFSASLKAPQLSDSLYTFQREKQAYFPIPTHFRVRFPVLPYFQVHFPFFK